MGTGDWIKKNAIFLFLLLTPIFNYQLFNREIVDFDEMIKRCFEGSHSFFLKIKNSCREKEDDERRFSRVSSPS